MTLSATTRMSLVSNWLSRVVVMKAPAYRKHDQDHDYCDTSPQTKHQRPDAFPRSDLPKPSPVQREMNHDQSEESIRHPSMQVTPLVTIPTKHRESPPPPRAGR